MKKLLLLALGLFVGVTGFAQSSTNNYQKPDFTFSQKTKNDGFNFAQTAVQTPRPMVASHPIAHGVAKAVTKVRLTSSENIYSALVEESNAVTANQATNSIMLTYRKSHNWMPASLISTDVTIYDGIVQNTFSNDYGVSWDSILQMNPASYRGRYPSGAIFNPAGNTSMTSAYALCTGPVTDNTNWIANFFTSGRLDSTHINSVFGDYSIGAATKQDFVRIGIQSSDDKVVVTGGLYGNANGTTAAAQLYRGATNNYARPDTGVGNFIWSIDSILPAFNLDATGTAETFTEMLPAWSQDGQTGYSVFIGVDANGATSIPYGYGITYQPIVYKTTNAGGAWTQMPAFNFTSLSEIFYRTIPNFDFTDSTRRVCFFDMGRGTDAAVDADGNLHIVSVVGSEYYSIPDSVGTIFNPFAATPVKNYYIYDVHTTSTGSWDAVLIDSILTANATTYSPYVDNTGATYTLNARLQMSKTTDGTKLFYFWMDTDPTVSTGQDAQPDIYGVGYDLTADKVTPKVQFTTDAANYFMYNSNIALVNSGTYIIPTTVSLPYTSTSNDVTTPWSHYYVKGVEFQNSDFTNSPVHSHIISLGDAIPTISANNFSVSDNYPNPLSDNTSFDVTLSQSENVTVDVVNILGTKVMATDYGKINTGKHIMTIDAKDLASGVYFYTVKAGNNAVTHKMVVKK